MGVYGYLRQYRPDRARYHINWQQGYCGEVSGKHTTARHGSMGELNEAVEEWVACTEWLDHYFKGNDVKTPRRSGPSFSVCVARQHICSSRSMVAPQKPTDLSYGNLKALVKKFLELQSSWNESRSIPVSKG